MSEELLWNRCFVKQKKGKYITYGDVTEITKEELDILFRNYQLKGLTHIIISPPKFWYCKIFQNNLKIVKIKEQIHELYVCMTNNNQGLTKFSVSLPNLRGHENEIRISWPDVDYKYLEDVHIFIRLISLY